MPLVRIDSEFEALIPKLKKEEFELLEKSILRDGCRDGLRVWGNILIDGHNRYAICKKHNIPFGTTAIDLADREEALIWIERNQLGRRNLRDDQRAIVAGRVAIRLEERSKRVERQRRARATGSLRRRVKLTWRALCPPS